MKKLYLATLVLVIVSVGWTKTVLSSTKGNELIADYTLGDWKITEDGKYSRIVAEDMDYASVSGAPLLPYDEFKIGLPPGGSISFTILESSNESITLPNPLIPVPTVSMRDGMSQYEYIPNPELYIPSRFQLVNPLDTDNFRGHSFVPLVINPFQYDGSRGLRIVTSMKILIQVSGNTGYRSIEPTDPATDVFLGKLLNKDQAKNWRTQQRFQVNYAPFSKGAWWVRIETNKDGMYRINPSQLSFLTLDDLDPSSFRMFSTSGKVISVDNVTGNQAGAEFREIPIMVVGESDHSFDPNDYILFYGSTRDGYENNAAAHNDPLYYNPYSQNQVFWLTSGADFGSDPLRMQLNNAETIYTQAFSSTQTTKHVENESQRREEIGFTWYSNKFFGNGTATYPLQVELSEVDPSQPQNLSFRIRQEAVSNTIEHRINVQINNNPLVESSPGNNVFNWLGTSFYTFNKSVSGFISGANTISLTINRTTTDNLFFDWYRVTYYQNHVKSASQKLLKHPTGVGSRAYRFDLSGNLNSCQVFMVNSIYDVQQIPLQGSYFIATGNSSTQYMLLDPNEAYVPALIQLIEPLDITANATQIDNVIVTPAEFSESANVLAQKYLSTYGIRSRVILQEDIFNQFNGGHPDPAAIRQTIRYLYHQLPAPRISSLTLLGLGTMDWRNYSGSSAIKNKIIVFQNDAVCSDDYFAKINTSQYPELAIGRYPVKSQAELNIMLQNFTTYTESPAGGWWRNSMVFLGDDLNNGDATYEYIHTQQTEGAANSVNPSIQTDRIFALEYAYDEFQNKPQARDDMFAAINEGRLVWYYIGHGSYDKLGAEDYLNGATDMGRFTNAGKQNFFMALSCKVSHFDYWGFESLGQKAVLMNNIGAIASYSATRVSYPDNNHPMAVLLLQSLANYRNPLGYAVMDAKINYTQGNLNDDVYVLLGDPVLRVIPPERDSTMQVSGAQSDSVLRSRDIATINGSFSAPQLMGDSDVRVFDTSRSYSLGPGTTVSHRGNRLFLGTAEVNDSSFEAGFVVPDDVITGSSGLAVSYLWDPVQKKDYTSYYHPLRFSDQAIPGVDNLDVPKIDVYLGSRDFRPGDTVGTSTTLYADISDANGINISGASGHNIMLVLDNSLQPIPITSYFQYDKGSYTHGTLTYPLTNLSEGSHVLQVIAFDNFNQPSVATTQFVAKVSSELAMERLLIYPNPINKDGYITFMLSMEADVNIGIFTVRGKRIRSIKSPGRTGFNSVYFDGRDNKGDYPANNTYFVKVEAKSSTGKSIELTEKMVIYK